nr:unnamed protein product [Callosobruchus analis]
MSFSEGTIPDIFKHDVVIPMHKKRDINDFSNYRAINLLSSFSKLFEIAIKEQLTAYLAKNNLLSEKQHGYSR